MRARWYDPGTGQFLSVDPDETRTQAAYYYAGDDPITTLDLSGDNTFGVCGGAQIDVLTGGAITGCVERIEDEGSNHELGLVVTGGLSIGVEADVEGWVGYQVSSASSLQQLKGLFEFVNGTAELGGGVTGTVFHSLNLKVWGVDVGLTIGAGAGAGAGFTDTALQTSFPWYETPEKWVLEGIWSAGSGPVRELGSLLAAARRHL
jgi:hypothetical protein